MTLEELHNSLTKIVNYQFKVERVCDYLFNSVF